MATIKSFTDLEQSKKLAEFLPLESADMYWWSSGKRYYIESIDDDDYEEDKDIRAWSLAALLGVIRKTIGYTLYSVNNVYMSCDLGDEPWKLETEVYDNPVDACVAMVEKLNELKML